MFRTTLGRLAPLAIVLSKCILSGQRTVRSASSARLD
jgi:hypothetical protein